MKNDPDINSKIVNAIQSIATKGGPLSKEHEDAIDAFNDARADAVAKAVKSDKLGTPEAKAESAAAEKREAECKARLEQIRSKKSAS